MRSFKFFLSENKKDMVLISTQFGSHSLGKPKKQTEDETKSAGDKFYPDPELGTDIHEDVDVTKSDYSDDEVKKFHRTHRMKDEKIPDDVAVDHPGFLRYYSNGRSMHMNRALWAEHSSEHAKDRVHDRELSFANELDKVVSKHTTKSDMTVFTGVPQKHAERFKNQNKPLDVHHPGFLSSSTDFHQAVRFTGGAPKSGEEKHVLRIHVPKGTVGGSMSGNTYYPKEKEFLFGRGHNLSVHHTPTVIDHPVHGKIHVWNATITGRNPKTINAKPVKDVLYNSERPKQV